MPHTMMPSAFDNQKAYVPQEEVFFDGGREEELVDFVTSKPSLRDSPAKILEAIDEFARSQKYLMNVGEDKGRIVTEIIRNTKPNIMVELGGYCGYSTILFADAMREVGGKKYFCLERSPKFAHNIEVLIGFAGPLRRGINWLILTSENTQPYFVGLAHSVKIGHIIHRRRAGLSGVVEVVVGPSNESIKSLHESKKFSKIDMMFLDHYKPAYTTDLKLCESLGLIGKGTTLAADNVIKPGNPPYLKYVRSNVHEKRMALTQAAGQDTENFPGRSATQYGDVEVLSTDYNGNPNLMYHSRLINSWEPSGVADAVEVTVCVGEEAA